MEYMDIYGTFKISDSQKIVDLTFTTSVKSNILISGNSFVDLPIIPGTSASDAQYIKTELVLWLNYDHPKYTCFSLNEGGTFKIENSIGKITNVLGIDGKLPKNIFALHKKHFISFDVENPDEFFLDPDIKKTKFSCTWRYKRCRFSKIR